MRKIYEYVVRHQVLVLAVFILAAVLSLGLKRLVSVNYDINDYLPASSHSTVSIDVLTEEFDGGIPNARVMIRNVSIPQAQEYKKQIQAIEGVTSVSWLDDAADLTIPLAAMDRETVETYYQDGAALFTVTLDREFYIPATAAIRELIGEKNALTGRAVSIADATTNTVTEVAKITVISVLFVLAILILTTSSWAEPVLVLAGLGVAIAVNGGTNLLFGEISFVTNAAGSILQLAVSLDYSVFLLHRFEECREEYGDPAQAMVEALCKSTPSILSSGLTTVIGFLALVMMQFRIGPDLGLALAKGVVISLVTVFLFMPALVLRTYRLTDRLRHRSFVPSLQGFGRFVRKVSLPMAAVFAVVLAPAYLASNANSYYYGASNAFGADTRFGADTIAIEETFGESDSFVLLVPRGNLAAEKELSRELKKLENVTSVLSYVDTVGAEIPMEYLDGETLALLVSDHYSRMVLTASVPAESEETFRLAQELRNLAETYYPGEYYLAGQAMSTYDLKDTVTADMVKVNLLAIGAVFLILVVMLRSLLLPVILVLSIETAIWLNLSVPYFTDKSIFYIAYLIISAIQLGSTVDYAILMADRYVEFRERLDKNQAVVQTVTSVTVSILTSGSAMVVVGLLMGYISSNQLLAQLGLFIGRGAMFSLSIVLLVLPGLLWIFDRWAVKKKAVAGGGEE